MYQIHYAVDIKTKAHRTLEDHERLKVGERLVITDADGWIRHDVRGCPLPLDQPVECKDKHGAVMKFSAARSVIGWFKAVKKYRPILNQEKHVTTTAHEDQFWPEPESGTNSTIPPRTFMTGAMKSSFNQPKQWRGPEDEPSLYQKAKAEHDSPSWDGEGLPPAGSRCKHIHEPEPIWVVAHHWDGMQAIWSHSPQGGQLFYGTVHDFMPIKTDRERWIEAANKACGDGEERFVPEFAEDVFGKLYDAGLARLPEE